MSLELQQHLADLRRERKYGSLLSLRNNFEMRTGSIIFCAAVLIAPSASFLNGGAITRTARMGKNLHMSM